MLTVTAPPPNLKKAALYFENARGCNGGEPVPLSANRRTRPRGTPIFMSFITHVFEVFISYDIMGESPPLQLLLLLSFAGRNGKRSPPEYALIHRKFAWGAHQDREDRRAHRVSFGLRLRPSDPHPTPLPSFPPPLPPFDLFS